MSFVLGCDSDPILAGADSRSVMVRDISPPTYKNPTTRAVVSKLNQPPGIKPPKPFSRSLRDPQSQALLEERYQPVSRRPAFCPAISDALCWCPRAQLRPGALWPRSDGIPSDDTSEIVEVQEAGHPGAHPQRPSSRADQRLLRRAPVA